jgi:pyruvyl transferase EpsO
MKANIDQNRQNHCTDVVSILAQRVRTVLSSLIPEGSSCALLDFPNYANVGDSAIWLGEKQYLKQRRCKIIYTCDRVSYNRQQLAEKLRADSIILLQGGGNFGDLWPWHQYFRERVIQDFPSHQIRILPQSICFRDGASRARAKKILDAHSNLTVLARDLESEAMAANTFTARTLLCPDMALLLGDKLSLSADGLATNDVTWLLRTDSESAYTEEIRNGLLSALDINSIDWLVESPLFITFNKHLTGHWQPSRELWKKFFPARGFIYDSYAKMRLQRGLALVSQGQLLVTDRLHAYIFALMLRRPHVILDNSYGKLESFWNTWGKDSELSYHAASLGEALSLVKSLSQAEPKAGSGLLKHTADSASLLVNSAISSKLST